MRRLTFAFAGILFLTLSASADECTCVQHKAKAIGSGSCSRTEDASLCTITFSSASSKRVSVDVLSDATRHRPEQWSAKTRQHIPDLLALSQGEEQQKQTEVFFGSLPIDAQSELMAAFASAGVRKQTIHRVGGKILAAASYGCFEIRFGDTVTTLTVPGAAVTETCILTTDNVK